MIKVNEYFDGAVKSLGFEFNGAPYTVGVVLPGEYSFGTEKEEHLTVILGEMSVRVPGENWKGIKTRETVVFPPRITFKVKTDEVVSYVCKYV